MIVRMWEAVVLPGDMDEALEWVRGLVADALATTGCLGAEGFVAEGDEPRLVLITRWGDEHAEDWEEGEPYRRMLRRAHAWWFRPLD